MNSIGCNICNLRKQNSMSQEQLAEKLNVSRQSVSKWERDEALPDIYNLEALADIFNVSIDYIVKDKANTPVTSSAGLSHQQIDNKEALYKRANICLASAIVLYVSCLFVGMLGFTMTMASREVMLLIVTLGGLISLATGLIIYQGSIRKKVKLLYSAGDNSIEAAGDTAQNNPYNSIFAAMALIVFLIFGFVYGTWHPAWISFPISALLALIANKLFPKEKASDIINHQNDKD